MSYKKWIFIAVGLFAIGIALGLAMPANIAGLLTDDLAALEAFASILGPFKVTTALIIFLKNVSALLVSFLFSPLLCLVPILALTVNGWLLSFVSVIVVQEESLGLLLAGLLPHGIFELPALIIGEAAALSFGTMTIVALIAKNRRSQLLPNLKRNLRYLVIACALLLPAAIIETYITPLFLT
ncbi:MAG TPA: stage II sporulation protein M [Dehalococcoidales bacterium]|nr:stage II sporulation protein M [Dehalococcoidales bacterium]